MKRLVLRYGVVAGATVFTVTYIIIAIVGADLSGATPQQMATMQWLGYVRYLILALGIVLAMRAYRSGATTPIGYLKLFRLGIVVAAIVALFVGAMEYCYVAYSNPQFFEQYAVLMARYAQEQGASAAEIAAMKQEYASFAWMQNPWMNGLFYVGETIAVGALLAALAALFMRRKQAVAST